MCYLLDQTDGISCVTCNSLFHIKCIPVKQEDVDYLNSVKKPGILS